MKSTTRHLSILYLGRDDEMRKGFADLLQRAGYDVETTPVDPEADGADPRRFQLVVSAPASPTPGARLVAAKRPGGVALEARLRSTDDKPVKRGAKAAPPTAPAAVMSLRALRDSVGKTQRDVARAAAMSQPQLSRIEARGDHLISTLRKYVHALGGDVEVVARIRGRRVSLRDV